MEENNNTQHKSAVGTASVSIDGASEPNARLRGLAGVIKFDKMRRQDPTIKSILSVIMSPLKGAQWTIRSQAKDQDKARQEMADLFYSYFWEHSRVLFNEFLSTALTMLPLGVAIFEKVWTTIEINGKLLQVLDLQYRPAVTIGEIDASKRIIKQNTPDGQVEISFDDLLFLVYDKEGNDYWGNSLLRPCYHAYEMKKEQYEFWNVAGARQATGFLWVGLPPGVTKDTQEYKDVQAAGKDIAANRAQMFMTGLDYKVDYKVPSISADFYRTTIQNLDVDIRNAALANFIGLGSTGTGSYSVGEVQYKLFMQAEAAIANQLEQVFTAEVLRPMTDVNFGPQEFYPELVCQDLDRDTVTQKLQLAQQFMALGIIKPNEKDEADLRYKLGLGENLDDDEQSGNKAAKTPKKQPEDEPGTEPNKDKVQAAKKPDTWEQLAITFGQELYRAMFGTLSTMADKAIADTRKHLDKKGIAGLADNLAISTSLYQQILIKKLSYLAVRGWTIGKDLASANGLKAAKKTDDTPLEDEDLGNVPAPVRGYVKNKAKALVDKHATGLKNVILNVANKPNTGFNLDTIIAEVGKQVDSYLSRAALKTDAETAAVQTLLDSEQAFYKEEVSDEIAYFTYKIGVADKHTDLCLWLKDHTYTPYGTAFNMIYPPNHFGCTGRMVPTFKRPGLPAPDPAMHDQVPPPSLMQIKQF